MRRLTLFFILSLVLLCGCTTTQKAATVGGVGGATLGGIIGHQSGDGVKGAAIGAAAGTIGGMIVGDKMDKKFCPECGRGFTEDVKYCPDDGTELKYKQR
jgi:outer membrane lipoprotein SlyB